MKGRAGGGGTRRRRGSRGGGLAGDAQTGAPGVNPTRAWFGRGQRVTRDPPGTWVGLEKVCGGGRTGDGGLTRRRLTGASVLGDARGYGLRKMVQKGAGDQGMLT